MKPTLLLRILMMIALAAVVSVPAMAQSEVYDNGPTDGTSDAWTINFGHMVSDSFTLTSGANLDGLNFVAWVLPGDVLQTVEVSITSNAFFGTTYFDQTVSFTQSGCVSNEYGYNICSEAASFSGPNLNVGTYWLTLKNASVNTGDPIYWDENSGPSRGLDCCAAAGDPVWASALGTIPSESFTLLGGG